MPENDEEIVIDENSALYKLGDKKSLNDKIKMTFEEITKEYTIVGIAEKIEEKTQNHHFSDGKDIRIAAITLFDYNALQGQEIVNTSVLMKNTRKIYDATTNLVQRLKLEEIPNVNKVVSVDRDKLEKVDYGGLGSNIASVMESMGLGGGLTVEQQEIAMPTEKVIYNQELLEILGVSNEENTLYNMFILIRIY